MGARIPIHATHAEDDQDRIRYRTSPRQSVSGWQASAANDADKAGPQARQVRAKANQLTLGVPSTADMSGLGVRKTFTQHRHTSTARSCSRLRSGIPASSANNIARFAKLRAACAMSSAPHPANAASASRSANATSMVPAPSRAIEAKAASTNSDTSGRPQTRAGTRLRPPRAFRGHRPTKLTSAPIALRWPCRDHSRPAIAPSIRSRTTPSGRTLHPARGCGAFRW